MPRDDLHIVFRLRAPVSYFPYILALWAGWPVREDLVRAGGAILDGAGDRRQWPVYPARLEPR